MAGRRRGRRRRQKPSLGTRILRHPSIPPLVTALWAAALAAAADSGRYAFAATVLVIQLAVTHGWLRLLRREEGSGGDARALMRLSLSYEPMRAPGLAESPAPEGQRYSAASQRSTIAAEPMGHGDPRARPTTNGEPSARRGGMSDLLFVSAVAIAADVVLLVGRHDSPGVLAVVLALGVSAGLFQHLALPARGLSFVPSLSGAALVMLAATWLVVGSALGHRSMLAIIGATGAAAFGSALLGGISHIISGPILVAVAAAAGWAISSVEPLPGAGHVAYGVALGVTAGLVYVATRVAGGYARARAMEQVAFAAAIPLVAVAPVAYLVGAILAG